MTKLVDHGMLKGKAPAAWKEPAYREVGDVSEDAQYESTRMELIVDESDSVLGCVTERYNLVQNRDLITALDLACDAAGMRLEPVSARYQKGRAEYKFNLPDEGFKVTGDGSGQLPQIVVKNDYRGSGGLGIMAGWFRMVCSNGMIVGEVAHQNLRRHVGEIDLYGFVQAGVLGIADAIQVERIMMETLAATRVPDFTPLAPREDAKERLKKGSTSVLDSIAADTAPRYLSYLNTALRENQRELGPTAYALVAAITQTSTHRMPGWTADEWATRQINRIKAKVAA